MMPPSLLIAQIGPVPIPIPVIVFWPLVALVWGAMWVLAWVSGRSNPDQIRSFRTARAAIRVLGTVRGLRVDLRGHRGPRVAIRVF